MKKYLQNLRDAILGREPEASLEAMENLNAMLRRSARDSRELRALFPYQELGRMIRATGLAIPLEQPEWPEDYATALNHFLSSQVGERLVQILEHQGNRQSATACQTQEHLEWSAGFACGFRAATAYLVQTLSSTANTGPKAGEQSATDPAQGAERLRVKLSP